jgi:hypothetical protein
MIPDVPIFQYFSTENALHTVALIKVEESIFCQQVIVHLSAPCSEGLRSGLLVS